MPAQKNRKIRVKILNAFRILIAGLGIIPTATPSYSATNYTQAADENTIGSYTSFILYGGPEMDIEKAFCKLRDLDESAAQVVADQYVASDTVMSLDLSSCNTTGLARLVII